MKNSIKALAVLLTLGFAGTAFAQAPAVVGYGTANATVITPISITPGTQLNFGNLIGGTGTVYENKGVMSPAQQNVGGVTPTDQVFHVAGQAGYSFNMSGLTSCTINRVGGGGSRTVTLIYDGSWSAALVGMTTQATAGNDPGGFGQLNPNATLDGNGDYWIQVGGSVSTVGAVAGVYVGTFPATVQYN